MCFPSSLTPHENWNALCTALLSTDLFLYKGQIRRCERFMQVSFLHMFVNWTMETALMVLWTLCCCVEKIHNSHHLNLALPKGCKTMCWWLHGNNLPGNKALTVSLCSGRNFVQTAKNVKRFLRLLQNAKKTDSAWLALGPEPLGLGLVYPKKSKSWQCSVGIGVKQATRLQNSGNSPRNLTLVFSPDTQEK